MNREKHKLPRRILALLLTMAMCVTMFPTAMFAEIGTDNIEQTPVTEKEWDISKSKTATNLDENYESEVTLSLPSAQEELVSDVVFVLDKSTSTENRTDIKEMLTQLQEQIAAEGGKVKVGVVYFNKEANEALPLTPLTEETMSTIEEAVDQEYESGTNIHAGLLAGKKMLDDDDEVDSNRKYLILLSDGISYIYNEEPTSTFTIGYEMNSKDIKPSFVCSVDAWGSKYGYKTTLQSITNKENAIEAVETFLYDENGVASKVKNDNGAYDVSYDTLDEYIKSSPTAAGDTVGDSNSDANHQLEWKALKGNNKTAPVEKEIYSSLYGDEQDEHANNVEKAMYLVVETFKAAEDAGYQCYAIDPSVAPNETYPWGAELMDYLAKDTGDVSFAQIKEEIYYLLDAGSTIEDYMGYQSGEDGYDFDLVLGENNENLYMTIEAVDAQGNVTDESKTLQAQKLDDKYVFGDPDGNGTYPYELTYTDGAGDTEHFVWKTNVPVTNFERVQLHYTVKLAEPQKEAGSYGYYDADGDGLYDANLDDVDNDEAQVTDDMTPLYTNNSATLTAKDSNGKNREEEFNKPSVSYTIAEEEPITITPADITIYTGGDGYGGVTDASGEIIDGTEATGLPEPGYHITLTESAVDWLSEQLGKDAGLTAQD